MDCSIMHYSDFDWISFWTNQLFYLNPTILHWQTCFIMNCSIMHNSDFNWTSSWRISIKLQCTHFFPQTLTTAPWFLPSHQRRNCCMPLVMGGKIPGWSGNQKSPTASFPGVLKFCSSIMLMWDLLALFSRPNSDPDKRCHMIQRCPNKCGMFGVMVTRVIIFGINTRGRWFKSGSSHLFFSGSERH